MFKEKVNDFLNALTQKLKDFLYWKRLFNLNNT